MKAIRDLLRPPKYDPKEDETVKALHAAARREEQKRRNFLRDMLVPPKPAEERKR